MNQTPPSAEHPWLVTLRRKLRERGFEDDRLEAEMNRMVARFPFLRNYHTPPETTTCIKVPGRDGLAHLVWKNPTGVVRENTTTTDLRGLLTASDLYVWQFDLPHGDFERHTALSGVRVALRSEAIQVNDETIDQPDRFPWIFQNDDADMEDRRAIVAAWLGSNTHLKRVYPDGFKVTWYS